MEPPEARIVAEALSSTLRKWSKLRIVDIVVGLHYGYVELEGGALGLFYSHVFEKPGPVDETLVGSAASIVARILSDARSTLSSRAAAWGVVNALTSLWIREKGGVETGVDEVEYLGVRKGSRVVMVGHIEPLAKRIVEAGAELVVVERAAAERDWRGLHRGYAVYPDTWLEQLLDNVDAVIVTGSSLAHPGAAHRIARLASMARTRALIGPSAGIHPEICRKLGYTHVGGSLVPEENAARVARLIRLGYGYRLFKRYVVKWFSRC